MKNLFSQTSLTHSACLDMMPPMALECFRTTLTHFVFVPNHKKQWKICFRRTLSHILHVWIWCLRWLVSALGQHSHSLWLSKKIWINEKSVFVELSQTFCVSRYDASDSPRVTECDMCRVLWDVSLFLRLLCDVLAFSRAGIWRFFPLWRCMVSACISVTGIIGQ